MRERTNIYVRRRSSLDGIRVRRRVRVIRRGRRSKGSCPFRQTRSLLSWKGITLTKNFPPDNRTWDHQSHPVSSCYSFLCRFNSSIQTFVLPKVDPGQGTETRRCATFEPKGPTQRLTIREDHNPHPPYLLVIITEHLHNAETHPDILKESIIETTRPGQGSVRAGVTKVSSVFVNSTPVRIRVF